MTNAAKLTVIVALGLGLGLARPQRAGRSAVGPRHQGEDARLQDLRRPAPADATRSVAAAGAELRNPHGVAISVTRLRAIVVVDGAHRRAGCTPKRDFIVRQLRARAYPLRLKVRRAARLSVLGRRSQLRVGMRDLPNVDQNACKGARLTLRYSGGAFPRRLGAPATGRGR